VRKIKQMKLKQGSVRVTGRFAWRIKSVCQLLGWICCTTLLAPSIAWSQCPADEQSKSTYRKTVSVTGFPFLQIQDARLGGISKAEIKLPQLLANKINLRGEHLAYDMASLTMRSMVRPQQGYASYFGGQLDDEYQLNLPDSQFVVSGVIVNAGETRERLDSFETFFNRQKAFLLEQKYHLPRRFELQLALHNHYTGELIYKKHYKTTGNWEHKRTKKVGVDYPGFWRTAYGQKVQGVLERAAVDIETALSCQPIMARVTKVFDYGVELASTPRANLKSGDTLRLYKVDQQGQAALFSAGQDAAVTVVDMNARGVIARFDDVNQWSIQAGDIVGAL